jgi:uncharacterized protein YegL
MKKVLELVFILDRSGSMSGLEKDTIGGFNSIIDKQKQLHGDDVIVSTVLFDHQTEVIHNRVPIEDVEPMDETTYYVGGSTALLDAVGGAIEHTKRVHRLLGDVDKPQEVMYIITTDGQENSSKMYQRKQIKRLVEAQQEKGWEFIFLGANINAFADAHTYGIKQDRTVQYMHDGAGTRHMYESVNDAIRMKRVAKNIAPDWHDKANSDFKKRSKSK